MALVIGVNSWATILEADEYLTNRLGTVDWFSLPDTPLTPGESSKETLLIMAYNLLVSKPGYCLSPGITDTNVIFAQVEMAFYFLKNFDSFQQDADQATKGLKRFKASKWEEDYARVWSSDFPLPVMVVTYLTEYMSDNLFVDLEID